MNEERRKVLPGWLATGVEYRGDVMSGVRLLNLPPIEDV